MDGLWTAKDIEARINISNLPEEGHLIRLLTTLSEHNQGLSNAELDSLLDNHSQWTMVWHLKELLATAFVEYKPNLFGEPGKYKITPSGRTFLQQITSTQKNRSKGQK